MYDFLIRSAINIRDFIGLLWDSIIGIFAPGQPGFLLILFGVVAILGKYGSRALQRRSFIRSARALTRLVQGFGVLVLCFFAYQLVQAVYPLVVKAVSIIK